MRFNRREMLFVSATVASIGSAPLSAALPAARLTYLDSSLSPADAERAGRMFSGPTRLIEADLVRQWRAGTADDVLARGALCVVLWDKALLLAELARENHVPSSMTRLGRSMFVVSIA